MSSQFEVSNPIYNFSLSETDGDASQIDLLGGKGANLAEMSKLGINVPPGFTITTEVCNYFMKKKSFPENLEEQIITSVKKLENLTGRVFNGSENLLLLSVRSGGRISMPGMMDSILNIGLNDSNVGILAKEFKDERFALDSYRRLIQMYSNVVLGLEHERFEAVIKNKKIRVGGMVKLNSVNVSEDQIFFIITDFKNDLIVNFKGSVPNLFEEGKGVVAEGFLNDNNYFRAVKILAKHDENYMPPEVNQALKNN